MFATGGVIYVGLFAVKALVSWALQLSAWWYMERHRKKFPNLYIVDTEKTEIKKNNACHSFKHLHAE